MIGVVRLVHMVWDWPLRKKTRTDEFMGILHLGRWNMAVIYLTTSAI